MGTRSWCMLCTLDRVNICQHGFHLIPIFILFYIPYRLIVQLRHLSELTHQDPVSGRTRAKGSGCAHPPVIFHRNTQPSRAIQQSSWGLFQCCVTCSSITMANQSSGNFPAAENNFVKITDFRKFTVHCKECDMPQQQTKWKSKKCVSMTACWSQRLFCSMAIDFYLCFLPVQNGSDFLESRV